MIGVRFTEPLIREINTHFLKEETRAIAQGILQCLAIEGGKHKEGIFDAIGFYLENNPSLSQLKLKWKDMPDRGFYINHALNVLSEKSHNMRVININSKNSRYSISKKGRKLINYVYGT